MSKLKTCPFCGGKAILKIVCQQVSNPCTTRTDNGYSTIYNDSEDVWRVVCENEYNGCTGNKGSVQKKMAIKNWNTRRNEESE